MSIVVNPTISNGISIFGNETPFNSVSLSSFGYHVSIDDDIVDIPDYQAKQRRLVVEQYERAENLLSILEIFASQVLDIEKTAIDVIVSTQLSNSVGVQLDGIGDIVGISRDGRSDDEYRNVIYSTIIINHSGGQVETVIEQIRILTDATDIQVEEIYPARMRITVNASSVVSGFNRIVDNISAAGVAVDIVLVDPDEPPFAFEDDDPTTGGFGEGAFATIIGA